MLTFDKSTEIAPPLNQIPVSVVMITKNCAASLRDTLESLNRNFMRECDEICIVDTGSTDDTVAVAQSLGARVVLRPDLRKPVRPLFEKWLPEALPLVDKETQFTEGCLLDFAEARQIAADAAKNDVQFWIDSDDVLEEEKPGTLRNLVNQHMGTLDAIFLHYAYTFDPEDQKLTTILKRERIYNRTRFTWKGKCHETCIPRDGVPMSGCGWFADYAGAIIHKHGRKDHTFGDLRNYVIIRKEIEDDRAAGRKPDLRSVFYLGNALRGLGRLADAMECYDTIIAHSGSRDDKFAAAYYVATALLGPSASRPVDALDYCFTAMRIAPSDPRGPFTAARAYYLLGRFEDSVNWYKMGLQLSEPRQTLHSYDPEHINSLPHQIAAFAYKELGDEENCKQCLIRLQTARPNHPDTARIVDVLTAWYAGRRLIDSLKTVAANYRPQSQRDAARKLKELITPLPEIPQELEEGGMGRIEKPDERPGEDLVFFCGPTAERWGPENRITGIGGSEKAVLEMSSRLQARGFRVTVYASVPEEQRGLDKFGVLWRHFAEFDYDRPRGTMVFWRNPQGALAPVPCRKRIVWCHDVQNPLAWPVEVCAAVDEVWVLSEFHASTLGNEVRARLGEKLVITRNGVDSALFGAALAKQLPRKANRVVYMSSPDRGVLSAIKAFQESHPEDPTAELHIFYGFNRTYLKQAARYEYAHFPDTDRTENYYDYMQRVLKAVDADDRIKWRGRVGPELLADELVQSGVWLYPTRFDEISCMAAMEAQCAGCQIVATTKAALAETLGPETGSWKDAVSPRLYNFIPNPDVAGATLSRALDWNVTEKERRAAAEKARRRFSYERLADEWADRLREKVLVEV